ncbi:hypothetical protein ACPPVT_11650 [Angustibacter sp. McL0619]|uniref:hypothetical protein n=1 Tax=Angustibacter sp. McL0619 TaxID=3415676 RepID=UPI003CF78912
MSVLDHLSAAPGVYWGEGQGPGGSRFVARVALQQQPDSTLTFDYEAWSASGGLQHAESARLARTGDVVTLAATSNGGDDIMLFREGDTGVFGSVGAQRVGLVISNDEQQLTFSWWWTGRDGELREQSRAVVAPMRQIVPAPPVPGADPGPPPEPVVFDEQAAAQPAVEETAEATEGVDTPADDDGQDRRPASAALAALAALAELEADEHAEDAASIGPADLDGVEAGPSRADASPGDDDVPSDAPIDAPVDEPIDAPVDEPRADSPAKPVVDLTGSTDQAVPGTVPWPGILVLHGSGTGLVAQRLAARLTRAAVVRTDLFDRAVRGTAGRPDPQLRQRIAVSVVQGYAATGHPVILHGASTRSEHEDLVAAISGSGLSPVQLVEIAEGEDYGEVARRLIESD